jgi:cell wall-associated NlpC family hydrolase
MHYEKHIIRNFPKNYPLRKKVWANILFFLGGTIIHPRKNALKPSDLKKAQKILKRGDLVLVGGLRRISKLAINPRGFITHSLIYLGRRSFIHSIADGVEIDGTHDIFCEYDTMIILRPKTHSKTKITKLEKVAKSLIGTPYDFEFNKDKSKLYCTQFVQRSYEMAGIKTGISKSKNPILPEDFLNSNFNLVFTSHNLEITPKVNLIKKS